MGRMLLLLVLLPIWSLAAPVSGIKDNDILLYRFSNTFSKDNYEGSKGDGPAICLYALKTNSRAKISRLTASRSSKSPCFGFFSTDDMAAYEVIEEYPASEMKEAAWNGDDSNPMPKQLGFETKLQGKSLNEAVTRLHAKCRDKNCASYQIYFVAGREAIGTSLPLEYGFYFGPTAGFFGYNTEGSFFLLNSNVTILESAPLHSRR